MAANQASSSSYDLVADLLNTNNKLNIVTIVGAFVFGFLAVYGCYLTVRHQRWERLHHRSLRHIVRAVRGTRRSHCQAGRQHADDPELANDEEPHAMQDLEPQSDDEMAVGSVHASSGGLSSNPPSIAGNQTLGDVESVSDTSHSDEADEDTSEPSGVRHSLVGDYGNGTTSEATTYAGIAAQAGSHNRGPHNNPEDNSSGPHNVVIGNLEHNTIREFLSGELVTSDRVARLNETFVGTQTLENPVDLGTDGIPSGQASSAIVSDRVSPAIVNYSITSLPTSGPDTADGSVGPMGMGEGDEIPGTIR